MKSAWALLLVGAAVLIPGCGPDENAAALPADATVTYTFRDSSVPPPYHRSFVITFDRTQARIVVDSYGTVLADRTAPMPPETWRQVSDTFANLADVKVIEPEQGCTGGTGFALSVAHAGSVTFDLTGTVCSGANSDAQERLREWIRPVRSLFPPMEQLAPEE